MLSGCRWSGLSPISWRCFFPVKRAQRRPLDITGLRLHNTILRRWLCRSVKPPEETRVRDLNTSFPLQTTRTDHSIAVQCHAAARVRSKQVFTCNIASHFCPAFARLCSACVLAYRPRLLGRRSAHDTLSLLQCRLPDLHSRSASYRLLDMYSMRRQVLLEASVLSSIIHHPLLILNTGHSILNTRYCIG